jgi:hypothetical protein
MLEARRASRHSERVGNGELQPDASRRAWIEALRGTAVVKTEALRGGAGRRRYWRVWLEDGASVVLMHAVAEDPAILPPGLRTTLDGSPIPFVEMTHLLADCGLPVPELYGVEPNGPWVLLEDLGDRQLLDLTPAERTPRYREAIDVLARAHAASLAADALPTRRVFDAEWVAFELALFLDCVPSDPLRGELRNGFAELARAVAALPRSLALRDYQSTNLMIDRAGRLRIIDYQDALLAPPELDLAALLFDSYVDLSSDERAALLARYAGQRPQPVAPEALALLVVQRKCKDFSRFEILVARGDERFASARGRARDAVLQSLSTLPSAQQPLAAVLRRAFDVTA